MASSSDKESVYKDWTLEELKSECGKRKLDFNESDNENDLMVLLVKNDNKPTDWGQIYSRVLYHTGMAYEEISRRTIPQILEILGEAEENIQIKMGVPNLFGTSQSTITPQNADEPPKVSQFAAMANMFSGI